MSTSRTSMHICLIHIDYIIKLNQMLSDHTDQILVICHRLKEAKLKMEPTCFVERSNTLVTWSAWMELK